jgi:hypothetical protein
MTPGFEQPFSLDSKLFDSVPDLDHLEVLPGISQYRQGQSQGRHGRHEELSVTLAINLAHELLVSHPFVDGETARFQLESTLSKTLILALRALRLSSTSFGVGCTGLRVMIRYDGPSSAFALPRKDHLTSRSSREWYEMTTTLPPGFRQGTVFSRNRLRDESS